MSKNEFGHTALAEVHLARSTGDPVAAGAAATRTTRAGSSEAPQLGNRTLIIYARNTTEVGGELAICAQIQMWVRAHRPATSAPY